MVSFVKYSSIENSYRDKNIRMIRDMGLDKELWYITEKIHGSNGAFVYDGKTIKFQKRSSLLGDDASFFNFNVVMDKYKQGVISYWNTIDTSELEQIIIYGELFGGGYEGVNSKYGRIQKGIDYTPDIEFMVFDMLYVYKNGDNVYQSIKQFNKLSRFGLNVSPILSMGDLDKCLDYPNEFKSTIGEDIFGLPPLKDENICEGVVLKLVNKPNERYIKGGSRIILKNKNEKWSEKAHKKKDKVVTKLTTEEQEILDTLVSYITENRLRNVISKIGKIEKKDFGLLSKSYHEDIKEEFIKEHPDISFVFEDRKFKKPFGTRLNMLIRNNFVNIIDGEF